MVKNKKEVKSLKSKGRPKGTKSKLPFTTFPDAINYAKMIWQKAQYNEMSFQDISSFMGLKHKKAVRVLNHLRDFYGVVEKLDNGRWRLTDAGKRIVKNEYTALKEVFSKDPMFGKLLNEFWSKSVTEGAILDHIKRNYKYTDAEEVKRRLLEGFKIIQGSTPSQPETSQIETQISTLPLFQLRYALKPPSEKELEKIVEKVVETLIKSNDDVLKLIADLINEKKKDSEELLNLLERAMKKLNLYTNEEEIKPKQKKSAKGESAEDETDESQAVG